MLLANSLDTASGLSSWAFASSLRQPRVDPRGRGSSTEVQAIMGRPGGQQLVALVALPVRVVVPGPLAPPSIEQLLPKVDVATPYWGFHNSAVTVDEDDLVRGALSRETLLLQETGPMAAGELMRHAANLGELSCALANPASGRHFYLGMHGAFLRALPVTDEHLGSRVEMESRLLKFTRTLCTVEVKVFLPASKQAARRLFGAFKVKYLVCHEAAFAAKNAAHLLSPAEQATNRVKALEAEAPYSSPYYLTDVARPAEDVRTAKLLFSDPLQGAGHFPELPSLPISLVMGGSVQLCADFERRSDGSLPKITWLEGTMKTTQTVTLGMELSIHLQRLGGVNFLLTITDQAGAPVCNMSLSVAIHT